MKRILIILLGISAFTYAQFSDKVIQFGYYNTHEGEREESATVFYEPFKASYMFVNYPVIQHIRMMPDEMLYYYPERNIALTLNNPDAMIATIPVQLFVNTGKEDLGLSSMGFELTNYRMYGDTLVRTWEVEGKNKDEYLKIDAFSVKNIVYRTISFDADKRLIKAVGYFDWFELSNYPYPRRISILEDGSINEYEFHHVKLLDDLPDSIHQYFILPDDCEIHKYVF